jgi:Phage capsid family
LAPGDEYSVTGYAVGARSAHIFGDMNIITRPFLPSDEQPRNSRPRAEKYVERACYAAARHAMALHGEGSVEQVAKALWSYDDVTPLVLKAATSPATTTTSGWAAQLATSAVGDFVSSLVPFSAGAKLFAAAVRINLDGIASILFPSRSGPIDPAAVPWVAQGAPIPVGQFTLTSATLGPMHKLAVIAVLTRETAEHGSGETVLTTLLKENAALALDASLFSTTAGTADRPGGLLAGVSALTASTSTDLDVAMAADLAALANAISDDTAGLAIVAHPAQINAIRLRRGSTFPADIPIWPSLGVAEGVVIVVDPAAVAVALGTEPEITSSKEALIHMETAPVAIGTPGAPPVVAAPSRSLFQTDCIAVRLILRATWALRAPGAVAWIGNTAW